MTIKKRRSNFHCPLISLHVRVCAPYKSAFCRYKKTRAATRLCTVILSTRKIYKMKLFVAAIVALLVATVSAKSLKIASVRDCGNFKLMIA